jgi:purine-binding chemotaxis protein CheW
MLKRRSERRSATRQENDTVQIVAFVVGGERYGLDIAGVQEIERMQPVTKVPQALSFVEGVIHVRGAIIPVVDLRKRFGLENIQNDPRKMRMIITRGALHGGGDAEKGLLGLVVDAVHEVLHVPVREIGPAPEAAKSGQAGFIAGVAKVADRLIIILDIGRILSGEERTALAEAGDVHP